MDIQLKFSEPTPIGASLTLTNHELSQLRRLAHIYLNTYPTGFASDLAKQIQENVSVERIPNGH